MTKRIDSKRLADLRDAEELARLEIETMRASDFSSISVETLTAGQIIIIADLVNALNTFRTLRDTLSMSQTDAQAPAYREPYAPPSRAEKRSEASFGGFLPPQYADTDEVSATDDDFEARKSEVIARLRQMLTGVIPDDQEVQTVNGPMRYADIPRDARGEVEPAWLAANCTCDEHEAARSNAQNSDAFLTGQYL